MYTRSLKKRCRIYPAGGIPQLQKSPKTGGIRGLKKTFSELSILQNAGVAASRGLKDCQTAMALGNCSVRLLLLLP